MCTGIRSRRIYILIRGQALNIFELCITSQIKLQNNIGIERLLNFLFQLFDSLLMKSR